MYFDSLDIFSNHISSFCPEELEMVLIIDSLSVYVIFQV